MHWDAEEMAMAGCMRRFEVSEDDRRLVQQLAAPGRRLFLTTLAAIPIGLLIVFGVTLFLL